ncbi:MAG: ABC transporter ATP-binding protein [Terriglobales bacterium]
MPRRSASPPPPTAHGRVLVRVLRPYAGWITAAAILGVCGAAAGAAEPLFYRYLLDWVIRATHARQPIWSALGWAVGGLMLVGAGQQVLQAGAALSVNRVRFDSSFALSRRMLAAVLGQPLAAHLGGAGGDAEEAGAGAVMTRMDRGAGALGQLVADGLQSVLPNVANLAMIAALLFALAPQLGWLALVPLPPFLWATVRATQAGVAAEDEVQAGWRRIYRRVYEVLGAIKTVKSLGGEGEEARRYEAAAAGLFARLWRLVWVDAGYSGMRGLLATAGRTAVLVAGAALVMGHRLSAGSWIAAVAYAGMIYAPLTGLTSVYAALSKNWVTASAALELLATADESGEPAAGGRISGRRQGSRDGCPASGRGSAARTAPAIEFDHVTFAYGQQPAVLRDLSFTLAAGEIVALVGPSGGGKTTIADLLLGLYQPTCGMIRADGRDRRELPRGEWRRQVAAVLQDPVLLDGTITENIAYGGVEGIADDPRWGPAAGADPAAIVAAARAAQADGFIRSLRHGYQTRVGERGACLSGGQKQRIAIARALARDAPVVVLDEASASLDGESDAGLNVALAGRLRGRTVLLISHRLSSLSLADRALVIQDGGIVEQGRPAELLAGTGPFAALFSVPGAFRADGSGPPRSAAAEPALLPELEATV